MSEAEEDFTQRMNIFSLNSNSIHKKYSDQEPATNVMNGTMEAQEPRE